jgi:hypothetical protein
MEPLDSSPFVYTLRLYRWIKSSYDAILKPQDGFHYTLCGDQLLTDLLFHTGTPSCIPYSLSQ